MEPQKTAEAARRILVVDDEEPIRALLQATLEDNGYTVETAADGGKAYQLFSREPFDIVITDLKMPGVSGETLFTQIKAQSPATIVIVLTGHGSLKSAIEALHTGCDDYLLKPLPSMDLLVYAIQRCLTRRDALARAGALRRLSQAQGEVLGIALEELSTRHAEMTESLERAREAYASDDPVATAAYLSDLHDSLASLGATVRELEKVQTALEKRKE